MKEYVGTGSTGRFTGLWSTLVNAAFSYGGVEMVAVAAGEAANPRKNSKQSPCINCIRQPLTLYFN